MATINPINYWRCDDGIVAPNRIKDFMNNSNLNLNDYIGTGNYQINTGGPVGNYLTLKGGLAPANVSLDVVGSFTIELLIRCGHQFKNCLLFSTQDDSISTLIGGDNITFNTKFGGVNNFVVNFDGKGRKSAANFMDGNWHHLVFKYDNVAGTKEIWLDGQCPTGFSTTAPKGTIPGLKNLWLGHTVSYIGIFGDLDEMCIYNSALPGTHILEHYNNFKSGQHYNFSTTLTTVPTPDSVTDTIDILEYAPGHTNGTFLNNQTGQSSIMTNGCTYTPLQQLRAFPLPRYKPGHTLLSNFNWMDISYMGGNGQRVGNITTPPLYTYPSLSVSQVVQNMLDITDEVVSNWNYGINGVGYQNPPSIYLNPNGTPNLTNAAGAIADYANRNPTKPLHLITLRGGGKISSPNLPANDYLRNSSGVFLDEYGNPTGQKTWSPAGNWQDYASDGTDVRAGIQALLPALPNRPTNKKIDIINENGEVFPLLPFEFTNDPQVNASKLSTGLDWKTYVGRKFVENETKSYRDQFMNLPGLEQTYFTEYAIDGLEDWRKKYTEARQINNKINNQYYSTGDFYPRWPNNWRFWQAAWHGMQWFVESRDLEIKAGDNLFSPFVAAGWSHNEEENIRPGQWLGLLKVLALFGVEFFYTGYFTLSEPFQLPENWIWQAAMPSYVQALISRYEDVLRNGFIHPGDYPRKNDAGTGYSFYTGDLTKYVTVRKHNSGTKYVIAGTQQPVTNNKGNVPAESVATIILDGQTLKFKVRKQGSVYIYDKTNATAPVFYQLDEWHESTHPWYWSKDFIFQAELFDASNNASIKTDIPSTSGDYSNFSTYLTFNGIGTVEYNFQPRTQDNQYVWVRARSVDGTKTGFNIKLDNSGTDKAINCIVDTNWGWYRVYDQWVVDKYVKTNLVFNNVTASNHKIIITSQNNKLQIDKIHITKNSSAIYADAVTNCGTITPPTVTIAANGATTFCSGSSVIITASGADTYVWNNGQTTASIVVTTSGNYSCVGTTNGLNGQSNTIAVTVNPKPIAAIAASGPLTFQQGGSVVLTATAGSSYVWSTNESTQSITVTQSGAYTVMVSNQFGCSNVSPSVLVNVTPIIVSLVPETIISFNSGGYLSASGLTTMPNWTYQVNFSASGKYYLFYKLKTNTPGKATGIKISKNGGSPIGGDSYGKTNIDWKWFRLNNSDGTIRLVNFNKDINTIVFTPNNNRCDVIEFAISKNSNFVPV